MDAAAVFALPSGPDHGHPLHASTCERAQDRIDAAGGVLAEVIARPGLLDDAVALALYVLEPVRREGDDDGVQLVVEVAALALALVRAPAELLGPSPAISLGGGRVQSAARGEFEGVGPELPHLLASLRARMSTRRGWPAGCAAFSAALGGAFEGIARDRELGSLGATVAQRDAADDAGVDLVAAAAAIVADDRTLMTHPSESELALRLGNGVVGRARDIVEFTGGFGPLRPEELVSQRFGIPSGVIRLGAPELERCLRALYTAELLDLADLLRSMDERQPLRAILARTCFGLLELQGHTDELFIASVAPEHDAIMTELRLVARLDGRITTDERALLRGMDAQLHAFEQLLARIGEDHVLDFEEFGQLRTARTGILDDLLRIALADDVVTDEERGLLVRALELLPMLRPLRG